MGNPGARAEKKKPRMDRRSLRACDLDRRHRTHAEVPVERLPKSREVFSLIWGVLIRFLVIGTLCYLSYVARFVWVTLLVSSLIALVMYPAVDHLSRPPLWGLSRSARRTVSALVLFVFVGLTVYWAYHVLVAPFLSDTASIYGTIGRVVKSWKGWFETTQTVYHRLPKAAQDALNQLDLSNITTGVPRFLTGVVETSAQWVGVIIDLLLIPILAFYFILEGRGLKREFVSLVPRKWRRDALAISRSTGRILRDYTVANLILCAIAGVVVYVGLRLLNVPFALSLAVLAGLMRFIPVIGPLLGGIPIILIALTQGVSVGLATLVFFTLMHLVESKVLLPKLLGGRLHMHGALVLIALLMGGAFAGIIGMFIAAPVAALLRVLLRTYLLRSRRYVQG